MFYHYKITPVLTWHQYLLDVMVGSAVILALIAWSLTHTSSFSFESPKWFPSFPLVIASKTDQIQTGSNATHIQLSSSQLKNLLKLYDNPQDIHKHIRRIVVRQLVDQGYDKRSSYPYVSNANTLITLTTGTNDYVIHRDIPNADALDLYLRKELAQYTSGKLINKAIIITKPITIPQELRSSWSDLYLFKNKEDLDSLGYQLVSSRTRVNKDKEYRRFNIMTAFAKLGNVRVLNPGQTISYLDDIHFDNSKRQNYKYGLSIIGDDEIMDYGGGICGSSTAVYQGILTNTALTITKQRAHSRRYSDLYPAVINGQLIKTPGIDSALYGPSLDLHFRNDRHYPVILVTNYDGSYGGVEEVFTLSRIEDQGSFEFVSSYKTSTVDSNGQTLHGGCYTWKINGETRKSCYKKVQ